MKEIVNSAERLKAKSNELKETTLAMCAKAKTGNISSSFSCADILTSIYYGGILTYDSKNPKMPERDRFILSKGHAAPILYAILSDAGYFPREWLISFCEKDGRLGVHTQNDIPGIEVTSGSLGHGLGIGAGMALAGKMNKSKYSVFVLLGDGELYEGSNWESAMFAGHNHLDNLIAIVDRNLQCATSFTEDVLSLEPLEKKWDDFGWHARTIDGHSFEELLSSLNESKSYKNNKPHVIIAKTIKGKGARFIEGKVEWHTKTPTEEEIKLISRQLRGE